MSEEPTPTLGEHPGHQPNTATPTCFEDCRSTYVVHPFYGRGGHICHAAVGVQQYIMGLLKYMRSYMAAGGWFLPHAARGYVIKKKRTHNEPCMVVTSSTHTHHTGQSRALMLHTPPTYIYGRIIVSHTRVVSYNFH